jgi:hypothetical protein
LFQQDVETQTIKVLVGRSSIWNIHLGIAARFCGTDGRNDAVNVAFHDRPPRIAQDYDRNPAPREILSITDVFICGQEHLKGGFFRRTQQFAIVERVPTKILSLFDVVAGEVRPERRRRAVGRKE